MLNVSTEGSTNVRVRDVTMQSEEKVRVQGERENRFEDAIQLALKMKEGALSK